MTDEEPKVPVIRIDGTTWDVIFPAIKKEAPTFTRIHKKNEPSIPTVHPITISLWDLAVIGEKP